MDHSIQPCLLCFKSRAEGTGSHVVIPKTELAPDYYISHAVLTFGLQEENSTAKGIVDTTRGRYEWVSTRGQRRQ